MSEISLLEFLLSGNVIANVLLIISFVFFLLVIYQFFCQFFSFKEINQKEEDFLANIADCLYDNRVEAARDLCKRVVSPESRIIRKGLKNIEKSSIEMFIAVENQCQIEILELKKNLFKFHSFARILMILGIFGTGTSLATYFFEGQSEIKDWSIAFVPMSVGSVMAMVVEALRINLSSLMNKIEINLKEKSSKFLEILGEIK